MKQKAIKSKALVVQYVYVYVIGYHELDEEEYGTQCIEYTILTSHYESYASDNDLR